VGIAWAGDARRHSRALNAVDRRRSLPTRRLAPLLEMTDIRWISLQKDSQSAEQLPLADHMAEMRDFADTAALIANLDLVISVDTAVAHLASALGKPVWLLDRFDACWRWLRGRDDSPWYPTLRIYRQPRPGDWDSVLDRVIGDLRQRYPQRERTIVAAT
jgi:ADP-heptose:LPS heptosyltransferase